MISMGRIISNYKKTLIITFFILSSNYIELNNSFTINNSAISNDEISNDEKFFILKVDDVGLGLERQLWFYELIENNKSFKADIGVIGSGIKEGEALKLKELIDKKRIEIYNHGWDHKIPEFYNKTIEEIMYSLEMWDRKMDNFE